MASTEDLPVTDPDFVAQVQAEYDSIFQSGTNEEVDSARYRLCWALVHSPVRNHQKRGLEICRHKLGQNPTDKKELRYFEAVALYKLGRYVEARRAVMALLQDQPDFRQASVLKGLVEASLVNEGLVGLGVGAAVVGVVLAFAFGGRRS